MKNLMLLLLPLFFFLACNAQKKTDQSPEEIALSDSIVIVDVRTPSEFYAGHIENSINIPLDVIAEQSEQLKGYQTIITVCRSGNRSGKAKMILEEKGFKNVYNGGSWQNLDEKIKKRLSKGSI